MTFFKFNKTSTLYLFFGVSTCLTIFFLYILFVTVDIDSLILLGMWFMFVILIGSFISFFIKKEYIKKQMLSNKELFLLLPACVGLIATLFSLFRRALSFGTPTSIFTALYKAVNIDVLNFSMGSLKDKELFLKEALNYAENFLSTTIPTSIILVLYFLIFFNVLIPMLRLVCSIISIKSVAIDVDTDTNKGLLYKSFSYVIGAVDRYLFGFSKMTIPSIDDRIENIQASQKQITFLMKEKPGFFWPLRIVVLLLYCCFEGYLLALFFCLNIKAFQDFYTLIYFKLHIKRKNDLWCAPIAESNESYPSEALSSVNLLSYLYTFYGHMSIFSYVFVLPKLNTLICLAEERNLTSELAILYTYQYYTFLFIIPFLIYALIFITLYPIFKMHKKILLTENHNTIKELKTIIGLEQQKPIIKHSSRLIHIQAGNTEYWINKHMSISIWNEQIGFLVISGKRYMAGGEDLAKTIYKDAKGFMSNASTPVKVGVTALAVFLGVALAENKYEETKAEIAMKKVKTEAAKAEIEMHRAQTEVAKSQSSINDAIARQQNVEAAIKEEDLKLKRAENDYKIKRLEAQYKPENGKQGSMFDQIRYRGLVEGLKKQDKNK